MREDILNNYDVVIVGGGFSGLTLAYHLPSNLRVLVLERKNKPDAAVESTGLITEVTKNLLGEFVDIDNYLPNPIDTIGVVSPDYDKYFFSSTKQPWVFSTDTPALIKRMGEILPDNVKLLLSATFISAQKTDDHGYPLRIKFVLNNGPRQEKTIQTKFLVGADGGRSAVAQTDKFLSKNKRFLAGFEKVFYGQINFGPKPLSTVYHFWFGEFSLGYGGWLSPTLVNGRPAFRVGLAKLAKDMKDLSRLDQFVEILRQKNIINIQDEASFLSFASLIPIGGVLRHHYHDRSLLVGDAAGFCGAFAADGIKGALVSAQVASRLIPRFLAGETNVFKQYHQEIQKFNRLIRYFYKQKLYRFVWDRMKTDRSFMAMYNLIANSKEGFLDQFCDSQFRFDGQTKRGLMSLVITWKNLPQLIAYAWFLLIDALSSFFKKKKPR